MPRENAILLWGWGAGRRSGCGARTPCPYDAYPPSLASLTLTPLPPGDQTGLWLAPQWLAPGQLPEIARVMAAYDATARREAGLMRRTAVEVLADQRAPWPEVLREQMLVIAMLGAAGSGDQAEVLALEQRYGSRLTRGQSPLRNVRMLLVRSTQG